MSPSTTLNISLADLIAGLYEELPDADDLARISEARPRAQTLSDLGEQLLDHYVSEAKLGGASWSEISDALGGTNQAALQRRAPNAFERFTDLNRHCIVLAQEAARTHKHELIGTGTPPARPAFGSAGPGVRGADDANRLGAAHPRRDRGSDAASREEGAAGPHRIPAGQQGGHRAGTPRVVRPRPQLGRH